MKVVRTRAAQTWRALLDYAAWRLRAAELDNAAQEARWLVQHASGFDASEMVVGLERRASPERARHLGDLLDRRLRGEPLQYVLGRWAFRTLDLQVDARVLIPRPETEAVAHVAVEECRRLGARVAVDLGTGSGAIALSLARESPAVEVWAADASPAALDVARANRARVGASGAAVRLARGSWYDALPPELAGKVDVIVSNPPYVAEGEVGDLPGELRWEPPEALVAGPTGLEAVERIVADAPRWLARPGSLVVEIAPHQAAEVQGMVRAAGFPFVTVWPDLTGRDRILLARA